ncbi:MAG: EutN/CcmL family microcompartment protein [Ignavibacteriales bacterium]|nr:EutN/CcmL family microcompartment protein [Ignavibacteriales bacterium]
MIIGKVIGSIVSTIKLDCYKNLKILLVQPTDKDGNKTGDTLVAVDTVRAGVGDLVIVASEGRTATEILRFNKRVPIRSVITGIIDRVDTES